MGTADLPRFDRISIASPTGEDKNRNLLRAMGPGREALPRWRGFFYAGWPRGPTVGNSIGSPSRSPTSFGTFGHQGIIILPRSNLNCCRSMTVPSGRRMRRSVAPPATSASAFANGKRIVMPGVKVLQVVHADLDQHQAVDAQLCDDNRSAARAPRPRPRLLAGARK